MRYMFKDYELVWDVISNGLFFLTTWWVKAFCNEIQCTGTDVWCNWLCGLAPVVLCTLYFYHLGSQAKVSECFKLVPDRNGSVVRQTQLGFRCLCGIF